MIAPIGPEAPSCMPQGIFGPRPDVVTVGPSLPLSPFFFLPVQVVFFPGRSVYDKYYGVYQK
jgi:hypothetical protein